MPPVASYPPLAESFARAEHAYATATILLKRYLGRPAEQRALFLLEELPAQVPFGVLDTLEDLFLTVDKSRYQIALVLARHEALTVTHAPAGGTP